MLSLVMLLAILEVWELSVYIYGTTNQTNYAYFKKKLTFIIVHLYRRT